jgi:hypothetical protein
MCMGVVRRMAYIKPPITSKHHPSACYGGADVLVLHIHEVVVVAAANRLQLQAAGHRLRCSVSSVQCTGARAISAI